MNNCWYNSKNRDRVHVLEIISEFVDDSPGGYQLHFPVEKNGTIGSPYWPLPGNRRKYLKQHQWTSGALTHKHGINVAFQALEVAERAFKLRRKIDGTINSLVQNLSTDFTSAFFVQRILDAHPNMKRLRLLFEKIAILQERVPNNYTLKHVRFGV